MATSKAAEPLDVLQQMFNEVLIQTGKALRAASSDSKGNIGPATAPINTRIPASIETFNTALDELESEILKTKSVLLRDLNQLRASRRLPPPPPPPELKPVAPPAPMVVDLESPAISLISAPGIPGSGRLTKQNNKPVAPFPNMGFDLGASPDVAATLSPKTVPKSNPKNSPRPAHTTATAGRLGGARKEAKAPSAQPPRPGAVPQSQAPQPSPTFHAKSVQAVGPNLSVSTGVRENGAAAAATQAASQAQAQAQAPAAAASVAATTQPGPESIFTNMNFSLAPPSETRGLNQGRQPPQPPPPPQQQQQQQNPDVAMMGLRVGGASIFGQVNDFGGAGNGNGNGASATDVSHGQQQANSNPGGRGAGAGEDSMMTNVDAKIDGLFDLGSAGMDMEMNYDLDGDGGDNSNFNDLYFNGTDDNMGSGEFDNAYFHL
ncbi:hypothetical protein B0T26DRAFT_750371 [Lasiosphaeria miniovina]|uniref:Uncharacterized protein n=1 Tax=Lasiosphaeria miniovina TaxID=1954250 RepID=A0AA40AVZ8_9PEZI|nr:uncharacterized protein B0T26DRAFT_750371 [Lasiosphaeria miniovina]KAK0723055.1 hypothetical protein B0T26DRAFT_750371 [Lasiosphaeria miniovina]